MLCIRQLEPPLKEIIREKKKEREELLPILKESLRHLGSIWIQFILLKTENWKHCNKIIFKCVNNVMRPIFNFFFFQNKVVVGPMNCSRDLQTSFFNKTFIKNGSQGTIHTFKNYFATVFSVFSFQQNKRYPNGPLVSIWYP